MGWWPSGVQLVDHADEFLGLDEVETGVAHEDRGPLVGGSLRRHQRHHGTTCGSDTAVSVGQGHHAEAQRHPGHHDQPTEGQRTECRDTEGRDRVPVGPVPRFRGVVDGGAADGVADRGANAAPRPRTARVGR